MLAPRIGIYAIEICGLTTHLLFDHPIIGNATVYVKEF